MAKPAKPTHTPLHHAHTPLVCGEHGDHSGDVIGCCHVCGLMLCRGHANYLPRRGVARWRVLHRFGLAGNREASPLVCGDHAPPFAARAGLPDAPAKRNGLQRVWRRVQLAGSRVASIFRRNRTPRRTPPPAHSRRG